MCNILSQCSKTADLFLNKQNWCNYSSVSRYRHVDWSFTFLSSTSLLPPIFTLGFVSPPKFFQMPSWKDEESKGLSALTGSHNQGSDSLFCLTQNMVSFSDGPSFGPMIIRQLLYRFLLPISQNLQLHSTINLKCFDIKPYKPNTNVLHIPETFFIPLLF